MNVIDTLTQRNEAFAHSRFSAELKIMPSLKTMIIGCVDPRVDPFDIFGLAPGEAAVIRNVGGRITPATLQTMAMLRKLVQDGISSFCIIPIAASTALFTPRSCSRSTSASHRQSSTPWPSPTHIRPWPSMSPRSRPIRCCPGISRHRPCLRCHHWTGRDFCPPRSVASRKPCMMTKVTAASGGIWARRHLVLSVRKLYLFLLLVFRESADHFDGSAKGARSGLSGPSGMNWNSIKPA